MKTLEKILIILMTFIIGLSSCSKESDNDCSDRFCLDSLSSNESDLTYYPIIDVHQHLSCPTHYFGGVTHPTGLSSPTSTRDYYNQLLANMDDNNVVLCLAGDYICDTRFFFDNYPEYNDRFKYGIRFLNYSDLESKLRLGRISEVVRSGQVKSIGELANVYMGKSHDDSLYHKLFAIADTFSLAIVTHMGVVPDFMITPNYSYDDANPTSLVETLVKFPNVNFCAAHFCISNDDAYDFDDDTRYMMKQFDNFYVDISPLNWFDDFGQQKVKELISKAIAEGLEHKILYGTDTWDWPDAVSVSIVNLKEADYLTVQQKKKILYWNAAQFLKLTNEEVKKHFGE